MSKDVKKAGKKLNKSERDYRILFESVPCYICVLNKDLEILESNLMYQADFGGHRGIHCYEACKKRDYKCPDCIVEKTFDDGQVRSNEETLTTSDGRELQLIVYTMPITDDADEISSVMEVFTDITEVKQLQRQLTLMGRAVAGMAHRIKNVMMGLEGGIFVVNTGMDAHDEDLITDGWDMVQRNVNLVSSMVMDLLYCSKKRTPKFKPNMSPKYIVTDVARLYKDKIAEEQMELKLEIDEQLKPGTYDVDGLHNLLCNLVANAIDACRFDMSRKKSAHKITLRCKKLDNGWTCFEVEDNGAGIPKDVKDKVFEEFFSTKGSEGTGVGLLVVQKVAHDHGGKVTFSSEEGKGTIFGVSIPPLP